MRQEIGGFHPPYKVPSHLSPTALGLDEQGRQEVIEVLAKQRVFPEIFLPFLKRIDYDEVTEMARRWCIADLVVIDPAISLGKPIIEEVGIATAVLAAA